MFSFRASILTNLAKPFILSGVFIFLVFILISRAYSAQVTLSWDDPNDPGLTAGYYASCGTSSGNYQVTEKVAGQTSHTFTGLEESKVYYFAVKAYDTSGNQSGYSDELVYTIPVTGPVDSDSDGITDSDETGIYGTDPNNPDTDGDGLNDGDELAYWGDSWNRDNDQDGVINLLDQDSDNDGFTDGMEAAHGPVADAGPDRAAKEGESVTLDASNSSDPDNDIDSYLWEQVSGTGVELTDADGARPAFTAPNMETEGALTFKLTVTDIMGLQSTDTCIVNISAGNQPPVADAGEDQTVAGGSTITLDGTGSSDPDGSIVSYLWAQTGGLAVTLSDPSSSKPTFTTVDPGSLAFLLTVTDAHGLQGTDTCIVNISAANRPPVANAGADQSVTEGSTVTLDGTASNDPDDGIASYLWTQTAGAPATLSDPASPEPTFVTPAVPEAGTTLTFKLTVRDSGGLQANESVNITVNDNGINAFPENVISLASSEGSPVGILAETGGACTNLSMVDASTFTPSSGMPEDMKYGLIDFSIKTDIPGGEATVTVYLPTPAPEGYRWYKYNPDKGWVDYSAYAVFNETRDQVTLTLVDGGVGDDDLTANGVIKDPSGLGAPPAAGTTIPAVDSSSSAGGGGGGCFITTATYGHIGLHGGGYKILSALIALLCAAALIAAVARLRSRCSRRA